MDALTDANDVTNGNSPQRAVIADSVVTVDSGDAQTNCSSTSGPCHLKWKTSQGQTAALGVTNGETSTPSDLAKPRLDLPTLVGPTRWNLRSGITSSVSPRNLWFWHCPKKLPTCTDCVQASSFITEFKGEGGSSPDLLLNSGVTKWLPQDKMRIGKYDKLRRFVHQMSVEWPDSHLSTRLM